MKIKEVIMAILKAILVLFKSKPIESYPVTFQLQPIGAIDINIASSILLDKLEDMGDDKAEIFLPDNMYKVFRKEDVKEFLKLDETDKIKYVAEEYDCDDFAAELFGKGLSLVWTGKHALNFFIDETNMVWFVEPQTGKISQTLETWQGYEVRFFLGR